MTSQKRHPMLVLGGSGMLGSAWTSTLRLAQIPFRAVTRSEVDYIEPTCLRQLLADKFSWVINCSGFTDVDGAESEIESAFASNAHFVGQLGKLCREQQAGVVHYSSDYVFDGEAKTPYSVDAPTNPINIYGKSKAAGERQLIDSGCQSILIRTSWVYAEFGSNFLLTILRLLKERQELRVVSDQVGRPTCANLLARASLRLLQQNQIGVHHVAGGGYGSWYDFARTIRDFSGFACDLLPCSTNEFPRPAARPAYSVLNISQTEKLLGVMPDWKSEVEATVSKVLAMNPQQSETNPLHLRSQRSDQSLDALLEPMS